MAKMRVSVSEDGPYLVSGGVPLSRTEIVTNEKGESTDFRETECLDAGERYQLCRCGVSKDKPYCDGSHEEAGFDGTETAGHDSVLEQSVSMEGPGIRIRDARKLCAEARFCDRAGGLWNLVEKCDDPVIRAIVEDEAMQCPSGRYTAHEPGSDEAMEPEYEPSIALIEDPEMGVSGPAFVRGGVLIEDADDVPYEIRNRVTLCRCGQSQNKPFCDGSHIKTGFHDATHGPSIR